MCRKEQERQKPTEPEDHKMNGVREVLRRKPTDQPESDCGKTSDEDNVPTWRHPCSPYACFRQRRTAAGQVLAVRPEAH